MTKRITSSRRGQNKKFKAADLRLGQQGKRGAGS